MIRSVMHVRHVDEQRGIGDNAREQRSGKTEQRLGLRARIVLGAADGKSNNALAKELKTSRPTVLD
jgi:DNA-binding CsgD family transcriptional regulator